MTTGEVIKLLDDAISTAKLVLHDYTIHKRDSEEEFAEYMQDTPRDNG